MERIPARKTEGSRETGTCLEASREDTALGPVVGRPFFLKVGRRVVDGDAPLREDAARVLDGGADPLLRLLDGGIGQADDREGGEARPDVYLDLDERSLEPDDRSWNHGIGSQTHWVRRWGLPLPPKVLQAIPGVICDLNIFNYQ